MKGNQSIEGILGWSVAGATRPWLLGAASATLPRHCGSSYVSGKPEFRACNLVLTQVLKLTEFETSECGVKSSTGELRSKHGLVKNFSPQYYAADLIEVRLILISFRNVVKHSNSC